MVHLLYMTSEYLIRVVFFRTERGNEPVREWLKGLPKDERRVIGEDIKTVQFGWPLGMPLVRKLGPDLWEVRTMLKGKIARTIFTVHEGCVVLLHGFFKKSQKTPADDLRLARTRMSQLQETEPWERARISAVTSMTS